jgi:succinoglycan biosynthesis transport protein ExoP
VNPTTTTGPQPVLGRQASAREFLAVLFRRKWIVLGLFLITTATVITVALTTPTTFISSGRILVKRGERQSALRPDRQVFSDWEQELGSEMQIVKSSPVVRRARELVAEEAKRDKRAVHFDPTHIDVEVVGKSNVIALGYTDPDPAAAQVNCRAVMDAYIEYHKDKLTSDRPQKFFKGEIAELEARISELIDERRAYSEQSGMASPQIQTQVWLQQVGSLEQKRGDLMTDLASAQSNEQAMKKLLEDPTMDMPVFDGGNIYTNEAALISLKTHVLNQQAHIAKLSETLRDDSPEVAAARQTLETLQALLRKEVESRVRLSSSYTGQIQAKIAVLDQEIATIHQQLEIAPQSLSKLEGLDTELSAARNRLRELTDKKDEALVTENTMADVNVVVLTPAGAATPTNPLDFVRLGLAPAFSLLVGIAIAFFIDGLDLTVRTANQAEEYLDLPVLASMSERRRRNG